MAAVPLDTLSRRFERFARLECHGSSPLYERLALAIAADPLMLALAAEARPDQPTPNLLFAAVHHLLLSGVHHPLAAFYPSLGGEAPPDADPYPAFRALCAAHAEAIRALITTRLVQTNEVRRSALLWPAFGVVARRAQGRPLALVEVGASAGLNLLPDRYGYDYGGGGRAGDAGSSVQLICDVRGERRPPVPATLPPLAFRIGVDLNPVDVRDAEATAWLRALIWPEHQERAELLQRALAVARQDPPPLLVGDALALLPDLLAQAPADAALCVVHTHTLNQCPPEARARLTSLLDEHGTRCDLYRISIADLFHDGGPHPLLGIVAYEGGAASEQVLAACDPHGRWLEWRASRPSRRLRRSVDRRRTAD